MLHQYAQLYSRHASGLLYVVREKETNRHVAACMYEADAITITLALNRAHYNTQGRVHRARVALNSLIRKGLQCISSFSFRKRKSASPR